MTARNVGNADRMIRVFAGVILISMVFIGPKSIWGWLGLVPLFTGLVGWCPAYLPFGINTCRK